MLAVNTYETGDQGTPSAAMSANGSFVVVWTDSSEHDGSGLGVYGRCFESDGMALGDEFCLSTSTIGNQSEPNAATDAAGNSVAVWRSQQPDDASGDGIYGAAIRRRRDRVSGSNSA